MRPTSSSKLANIVFLVCVLSLFFALSLGQPAHGQPPNVDPNFPWAQVEQPNPNGNPATYGGIGWAILPETGAIDK
jgi:hypothetical protein